MKPKRKRDQGRRGFEPQPAEKSMKELRKLLREYTTFAYYLGSRSWANHSRCTAVDKDGVKRTHHRARTAAESHRRRRRQAQLRRVSLRSLTCWSQSKSSSRRWDALNA